MKCFILLIVTFCFHIALTQQKYNWGIEYRSKIGFLAAHHNTLAHIAKKQAFAHELSFFLQPNGSKKWHLDYRKPLFGITGFFGNVSNHEILGEYYGIYQFIEFPFIKRKHYIFGSKLGNGFAYGTKHYDPIDNPKNTAIGSHLNALICFGLMNRFEFNRHHFSIGLDLTHCSNASTVTPNLGINLPFLSVSYGYNIKYGIQPDSVKNYSQSFRKLYYGFTGVVSEKEIYPIGARKYPIFALSLFSRYLFKPKVGMELSFDIFSKQSILGYKTDIEKTQFDIIQMGVFTGYILPIDRFHFIIGMGVYVRDKYQPDMFLYHRVGMRYFAKNGLFFNAVLKSHFASADYFESGIGYTFNFKNK